MVVAARTDAASLESGGTSASSSGWPIVPTTVLTATVSPSLTLISVSTPAAGAGISASTLSVVISKRGSSRSTRSPTFLIQRTIVPSAIDSPIWGMTMGVAIALQVNGRAMRRVRGLAYGLGERGVCVNGPDELLDGALQPKRQNGFGDELGGPWSDHVHAQHFIVA